MNDTSINGLLSNFREASLITFESIDPFVGSIRLACGLSDAGSATSSSTTSKVTSSPDALRKPICSFPCIVSNLT